MKKVTVIIFCLMALYTQAQNTFPPVGNVGIGTTTPATKLQIFDGGTEASPSEILSLKTSYGTNAAPKALTWRDGANVTAQIDTRFDGSKVNMVFGHLYNIGYSASDLMTILGNGNIGIGTSTPNTKLQIFDGGTEASPSEILSLKTSYATNAAPKAFTWRDGGNVTAQIDTRFDGSKVNMVFGHLYNIGYSASDLMTILGNGNVGIGTMNPTQKLSVNGTIQAKEIVVNTGWSDFVFDNNYKLRPLTEVEQFVKTNKHLPEIPSQKEVEKNGVQLGDISSKLLMKIEELTLYVIEMKKEIQTLQKENAALNTINTNTYKK